MIDYRPLIDRWQGSDLDAWAQLLPDQVARGLCTRRYGDLPRWLQVLADLPDLEPDYITLDSARVGAGSESNLPGDTENLLRSTLQGLHPWRKGPFSLFGVHVDTEWRSDWKWSRVAAHLPRHSIENAAVLDVGCGGGILAEEMGLGKTIESLGVILANPRPTPAVAKQHMALVEKDTTANPCHRERIARGALERGGPALGHRSESCLGPHGDAPTLSRAVRRQGDGLVSQPLANVFAEGGAILASGSDWVERGVE